jgi:AsmA protein
VKLNLSAKTLRSTLVLAAISLAVLAAVALALPYFLARQGIEGRIRSELSSLSGMPVALQGNVSVTLFPRFAAIIHDVQVGSFDRLDTSAMRAKVLEVELSRLAALKSQLKITSLRISEADIRLVRDSSGHWLPAGIASPLAPVILAERQNTDTGAAPSQGALLNSWNIGSLRLSSSRLSLVSGGRAEDISDADLMLSWPSTSAPLTASGGGTWRGKPTRFSARLQYPIPMAAGNNSAVTLQAESGPATLSFDGFANLQNFFFTNGDLKFETPSMGELLNWIGAKVDPGATMGSMGLSAKLTAKDDHLNFNDAVINFNGNPASGVFELKPDGKIPALSGTLAFEKLDLASFLAAFSVGIAPGSTRPGFNFLHQINLDLRLSASAANVGELPLTEIAAAIRIKGGQADFDLGDAAFAGGRLRGDLKVREAAGLPDASVRLRFSDLDPAQFFGSSGGPVISAPVGGTFEAEGKYAAFLPFMFAAEGDLELESKKGGVRNFGLVDFRQRLDAGALFNLPVTGGGVVALDSMQMKARVKNGVAIVSDGRLSLAGGDIWFTGALPILSDGVALSGQLTDAEGGTVRRFFVGGSTSLPFVTPVK